MNTKRLSAKMEKSLIGQATKEAHAAQIFLSYGSWAESKGYPGIADFFYGHAHEERNHMMKIVKYVNARGGYCKIEAIPAPGPDPKTLKEMFEKAVKHEFENTEAIYAVVNLSHEEKDWATFNFMQWFVEEQIEEEALVMDLLAKYEMAENVEEKYVYDLDRDLSKAPQDVEKPRDAKEGE